MWELRFLGHAFGIIDNDYYVTAKDGTVTSGLTSDQNREFLSWLHELWTENLIDHNGFIMSDSLRTVTDESKPMTYGLIMSSSPVTVIPAASLSQYTVLDPLSYDGIQQYRDLSGDVIRGTFAVTKRCAQPEKLVSWVNYLYTEEGAIMSQYGLEGQEYNYRDDGAWEWTEDTTTVAQYMIPATTIGTGAAMPGICPVDFQLKYSDKDAKDDIAALMAFRKYLVLPFPYVTLSKEDEAEIAKIQKDLSAYAETAMARFVTGDVPLDDTQWAAFCKTVEDKGLSRMIEIWQKYVR
jgi:putative aldouronate transport system substrate-binding protein